LSSEWNNKEEKVSASSRLEQHLGKFLTSRDLSILLRIRWLRCYVFSTLYYGMKGCTLTKAMRNQLGGFEMCCCRHPEGFNVGINTLTSVQTTFIWVEHLMDRWNGLNTLFITFWKLKVVSNYGRFYKGLVGRRFRWLEYAY